MSTIPFYNIFLLHHHISYNTSCFRLGIAVFPKEIEDNAYAFVFLAGERGGEGGASKVYYGRSANVELFTMKKKMYISPRVNHLN